MKINRIRSNDDMINAFMVIHSRCCSFCFYDICSFRIQHGMICINKSEFSINLPSHVVILSICGNTRIIYDVVFEVIIIKVGVNDKA